MLLKAVYVATALVAAQITLAQEIEVPQASDSIATGTGAILRGLDRVAGSAVDFDLPNGSDARLGHLIATLRECRYPVENPAGEAWAWIDVYDTRADEILFSGWMVASSPALNALDHRRYDLWVLNCRT
jgi:hypothetical protein